MEHFSEASRGATTTENVFSIESLLAEQASTNSEMANGINLAGLVSKMNNSISEDYRKAGGIFQSNTNQLETLQSPWLETSINEVEPTFYIPKSFKNIDVKFTNKDKKATSDNKIDQVSETTSKLTQHYNDETLFYLFYKHPGTVIQELTYLQLRSRNWRYHKVLKMWLTKLPNIEPVMFADNSGERGVYFFWDYINWCKKEKEFELVYSAIM